VTDPSGAAEVGQSGLVASDVERSYDGFTLGPVSLHVPPGRALGLLGSNGAGKTTLLAGLAGQARLHGGTVAWNGEPIRHGERVSFVRDVPALYGELTVRQTMTFVSRLQPTWRAERATELLELFHLEPWKLVKALSRGMKAKLGLLLAASHDAQLLLLDEVTAGVDADTRDDIQAFLRGLVQHGVSVIVSSHIFEDIEHVGDDILILRRGIAAFGGTLADAQLLVAVSWEGPTPPVLLKSASVVGTWTSPEGTTVVVTPSIGTELEDAFRSLNAVRRPASLRDLYFAYRDRS
jgi:ABC-2 type transport system ATP-binding protein